MNKISMRTKIEKLYTENDCKMQVNCQGTERERWDEMRKRIEKIKPQNSIECQIFYSKINPKQKHQQQNNCGEKMGKQKRTES